MLEKLQQGIEKSIKHLEWEFAKLQLGRANPAMIESILVEQYWNFQPLQNLSSISNLDAQTLSIKPWDKTVIHAIAKAITESHLGLNPQVMADSVLIKVPPLTEERRKEVVKIVKTLADDAKVAIRVARQENVKIIKKAEDEKEISENQKRDYENELQKIVDDGNKKIEEKYKQKETEIMKI